jgi:putative FmdB family regulatory protein
MPIYAYKCDACGHAKDILQKISDPVLTDCPACGATTFKKQVTAAGFQLKGSGWYVTDFRGGSASAEAKTAPAPASDGASTPATAATPSASSTSETAASPAPVAPSTSTAT